MEQAKNKKEPTYRTTQNVVYFLKNLWRWNRMLFFMSVLRVPVMVAAPFLGILLPKIVLDCLTTQAGYARLALNIALATLGIALCSAANHYLSNRVSNDVIATRVQYIKMQSEKTMRTDFENLESAEGRKLQQKANQATNDNRKGTEATLVVFTRLSVNAFGILSYGALLTVLSPWFLVFLTATAAFGIFSARAAQRYEYKNRNNWTLVEKKIWYLIENARILQPERISGCMEWADGLQLCSSAYSVNGCCGCEKWIGGKNCPMP